MCWSIPQDHVDTFYLLDDSMDSPEVSCYKSANLEANGCSEAAEEPTDQTLPLRPASIHKVHSPILPEQGSDDIDSEPSVSYGDSPKFSYNNNSDTTLYGNDLEAAPPNKTIPYSTQIRIRDSRKNKWGYSHPTKKHDCSACSVGRGSHSFECLSLDKKGLPPAFRDLLASIQHFLSYVYIETALWNLGKGTDLGLLSNPELPMPSILMAMGLDWDKSCAYPFLKRLLKFYDLQEEVVCVKGFENDEHNNGIVDMVICLEGSDWRPQQTPCDAFNFIPICPIVIKNDIYDDSTDRLRKWLSKHFDHLQQSEIVVDGCQWPVPYFVVDGDWWRVGFAVQDGSTLEMYDEAIDCMGWTGGVHRLMIVLQHVVKSTAERYREWYQKHGRRDCPSGQR